MVQTRIVDSPRQRALDSSPKGAALAGLLQLLLIGAVALLAIYRLMPPAAVAAVAPPTEFSSGRAMKHLEVISRVPHPVGSQGHAEVREYLLKELAALGASPEAVTATALDEGGGGLLRGGTVRNVLARIPGANSGGKAVMLTGHYDTVPNSPGASDDGAGVAAILETVRAVKAGGGLKNDLIVLLTDGEEVGLLGARAFVAEHPWAKDVGLILNFEARGSGGPVLMFETSPGNGRLIEEFAESVPHPVSNSLLYEVYKILPNDTDFTVFKKANLPGLNFAYIDGVNHYHTSLDNITSLDQRSLQHHGSYALALTRHAGGLNLTDDRRANDSVYFDVLGAAVVRYSKFWVVPLTVLACLLFVLAIFIGLRKRSMSIGGLVLGALAGLVAMLVAYGCAALVVWVVGSAAAGNSAIGRSSLLLAGLILLAVAAAAASYAFFGRRAGALNLLVGGLVWWVLAAVVTTVMLPTASYLFTWPLLLALFAALFALVKQRRQATAPASATAGDPATETSRRDAAGSGWVFSLCALVAMILFAPVIYLVYVGMSLGVAAALTALAALLLALFLPTLGLSTSSKRWLFPVAAACAGLVLILAGFFNASSGTRPKADSLFYALNADGGKAAWGSVDARPDEWTAQFLTADAGRDRMADFFPFGSRQFLTKDAAPVPLEAPRAEVLSDQTSGNVRQLKLRITSPRAAPIVSVYFDEASSAASIVVNGRPWTTMEAALGTGEKRWILRYYALPPEGIELALDTKAGQPFMIRLVDQSYGLPASLTERTRPRPDGLIPVSLPYNDSTMVTKVYTF